MAFGCIGYGRGDDYTASVSSAPETRPKERQKGSVIAVVGQGNRVSKSSREEILENAYRIDDELLGYNTGRVVLVRCKQNDSEFEVYLGLPFTKGMTERETGRTLLILNSSSHHKDAMAGQFDGALWKPDEKIVSYGDTIRWLNVGDTQTGFIGLDYNTGASINDGVATNKGDIGFLAKALLELGYDPKKRMFLLKPPFIVENDIGKEFRNSGFQTLEDYVSLK